VKGFIATWRAALRVSRRETRRARGRSALVIAMIGLPVLGLAFAAVSYDMFNLTKAERADRLMGTGNAYLAWLSDGPVEQGHAADLSNIIYSGPGAGTHKTADVLAALPDGSRATEYRSVFMDMRTRIGIHGVTTVGADLGDPLVRGRVNLVGGRAPSAPDEVALNRSALDLFSAKLGSQVRTVAGRSYTVVGIAELPDTLASVVVMRPDQVAASDAEYTQDSGWLVATPTALSWDQVQQLNKKGIAAISRPLMLMKHPPTRPIEGESEQGPSHAVETISLGAAVAGMALLEIVLMAGPAFAVGARRRRRDLALIAANGGTPAHLRRMVLADGVVLGLAAGAVGILLGVVSAFALRQVLAWHLMHMQPGGYRVLPAALAATAGLAIVTGVLAALVPAFVAARQDVVTALTGRRGVAKSRKRWLAAGVGLAALGTLVAAAGAVESSVNVIVGGLALGELGLVVCTPSLVGLIARLGRVLPAAPRIALRDTARNRGAASPAISAVMAAVAGSIAIAVYLGASHERDIAQYDATLPIGYVSVHPMDNSAVPVDRITKALRDTVPATDIAPVSHVICGAAEPATSSCWLTASMPAERRCPYNPDQPLSQPDQAAAAKDPRCDGDPNLFSSYGGATVADDGPAVGPLTAATPADVAAATAVLRTGGAIVSDPRFIKDGMVTLEISTEKEASPPPSLAPSANPSGSAAPSTGSSAGAIGESGRRAPDIIKRTITVPGYAIKGAQLSARGPIVSSAALAKAGLSAAVDQVVAATNRMPTQAERDALSSALTAVPGHYSADVETGPDRSADPTALILAIAAAVVALGAAGIATGLAAADGRADLSTLAAIGAAPRVRRALSLSQSGVIAGLGSVLGCLAGLGAAFAILTALNAPWLAHWPTPTLYPLTVPWLSLGIALVAVPAVAMGSAGLLTRSRLPIERRVG
jgi:putative ABC transport system permease protein